MEPIGFFQGTRVIKTLFLSFYDGRARLECEISERWGPIIVHSLKCGAKYVRKLKRSIGMAYTEKDDLESLVSGSLGLKGVASLDAQISKHSGVELQLSRSEEIEDEFTFEAPKCGEKVIALYQLRRNINLKFRDNRPFHKKDWSIATTYWVDRIHDNSCTVSEIPECGCKSEEPVPSDGRIYIDMGNVTMTTEFFENGNTLRVPSLDIEVEKSKLDQPMQFKRVKLPSYLLFLAGPIPETVDGKFSLRTATEPIIKEDTESSEKKSTFRTSGYLATRQGSFGGIALQEYQFLIDLANKARSRAYAPYSNYPVGAALRTKTGRIFIGVNVENAAFPSSVCAECTAVFKAVSEGERDFEVIAVVSEHAGSPCGSCRQVLAEFGLDTIVLIADGSGKLVREAKVRDLLPEGFTIQQLENRD